MDVCSWSKRPAATNRKRWLGSAPESNANAESKRASTKTLPDDPAAIRDESLKEERTSSRWSEMNFVADVSQPMNLRKTELVKNRRHTSTQDDREIPIAKDAKAGRRPTRLGRTESKPRRSKRAAQDAGSWPSTSLWRSSQADPRRVPQPRQQTSREQTWRSG
jgi:hypothetical protein